MDQIKFDFEQAQPVYLKREIKGVSLEKVEGNLQGQSPLQSLCGKNTYLLKIEANQEIKEPIELELHTTLKDLAFTLLIYAEENSKATVIERWVNQNDQLIICHHQTLAENNAQLRLINVQNLTANSHLFEWREKKVRTGAELKYFNFQIGAKNVYSDVIQKSEAPEARLKSEILTRAKDHQNFTLKVNHVYSQKNSKGEINARGAALEKSKVEIQGGVHITPTGSGCEGFLQQNCLLLSPQAQIKAIPALKVDTNDVKAGHGAAISNLNEEAIFYMMSRGMSEVDAKQLLLNAFLKEVLNKISDLEELKEEIEKMI